MTPAVLDCSVLLKWFFEESGTVSALHIRDRVIAREIEMWAPALVLAEFTNIVWHKTERLEIDETTACAHVEDFLQLPLLCMALEQLALPALRLAHTWHITVYDACYMALADHLSAPLITADRRLANVIRNGPVAVEVIA
ncbi:MAG: type II toxin-antitoxin system VapC family toxin [Deltaproteobacteria bacterium]|nr:type II toxin-antitoxin system VapC family toxin [Deltaproteobacteria bacterium]